jgi:4-hydroxy-tetrahydrodipicolinate synthase
MFKGSYTALITPFTSSGGVDYEGFRRNIALQLAAGITGVVVCGTTGEPPTLTDNERESLVRAAVGKLKGKATIIVGAGSNSTDDSVKQAKRAEQLGADAVLVVTPYYSRPSDEGVFRHFKAVAEAVSIPVVVYNIQSRTGKNIEPELMTRLSEIPNIQADKESSGSAAQCGAIVEACTGKPDFSVLSGDDGLTLPFMAMGARGVVSVIANAVPKAVVEFVNAAASGDYELARKLHYSIIAPMTRLAFIDPNPIPIKYICSRLGMAAGGYRLPLCEMDEKKKGIVDEGLRSLGLI